MSFNFFQERLKIIKGDYKEMADKMNKALDNLKILFDDLNGVYQSWLSKMIDNHLITLFMQVNPKLNEEETETLVNYYVWEKDLGGKIEVDGKAYDLSDDKQLYNYLIKDLPF